METDNTTQLNIFSRFIFNLCVCVLYSTVASKRLGKIWEASNVICVLVHSLSSRESGR